MRVVLAPGLEVLSQALSREVIEPVLFLSNLPLRWNGTTMQKSIYNEINNNKNNLSKMKKYLFTLIVLVCAVTGAWAVDFTGGSITSDDNGTTTLNITSAGAFGTWYCSLLYYGDDATYRAYITDDGVTKIIVTGSVNDSDLECIGYKNSSSAILDLRAVTYSGGNGIATKLSQNNSNMLLPSGETLSSYTGNYSWIAMPNNNGTTEISVKASGGLTTALTEIGNDLQTNLKIYGTIFPADQSALTNLTTISVLELSGVKIASDQWGNDGGTLDLSSVSYSYSSNSSISGAGTIILPQSHDPYTVSGCDVTINMDYKESNQTLADLIALAKTAMIEADATMTHICTLTVQGEVTNDDLAALGGTDMTGATRIDLSDATLASGASIENIELPSSLETMILPKGDTTIPEALRAKFARASNLLYAYSPTSDNQTVANQFVADLVWVNEPGGLNQAIINEAKLRTAVYVKIESTVALNADDVDLTNNKVSDGKEQPTYTNYPIDDTDATNYGWQFIDMSGANLQPDVCASSFTKPYAGKGYRLILPDNWSADQMAIIASLGETAGSIAAVYSYIGNFIQILEINDVSYSPTALSNDRIVRDGTKAIRVVSGTYKGTKYGTFGQLQTDTNKNNLFKAINAAKSSIEAVTITDVTTAANEPLTFTNDRLIYIQLDGVKSQYDNEYKIEGPIVNVSSCSSLKTLNLLDCQLSSVSANVSALTKIDMSGTGVNGKTDLSESGLTSSGFVTSATTEFKGDLDLSTTALTTFSTGAKVAGDIILNENNLTSVSLNQVQFNSTTSKIYVRKSSDYSSSDYNSLTGSLDAQETIIVPIGFDKVNRIVPYVATTVKEETYVAPTYVFSDTDMRLHEAETTGETPDKFVYWYTGDNQTNKVLTITMTDERRGTLSTILSNAGVTSSTELVKVKITGVLASNDLAALASLNTLILDLSEATLQKESSGTYTSDVTILESKSAINQYVKFLILPAGMVRDDVVENNVTTTEGIVNGTSLDTSFPALYSAISLSDYDTNNSFDFVAYNKVRGTLQPMVVAAGRGTINGSTMIRGGRTAYYPTMSGNANRSATISGEINAYDLSYGTKLSADGHLVFDKRYADETLDADDRTNAGTETNVAGAFAGSNGPRTLDLKAAKIQSLEYINDICISYLTPVNYLKYLMIPETSNVKETPSYFIQHNAVKEICIPSNIEVIRTHFGPSLDHIWTNGYKVGQTGGDLVNTKYDNGAFESTDQEDNPKAANYGYTDYTFSGLHPYGTYTFSSNLKMIESKAFANSTPHVKDVYVLAKKAPECHVDAFCTAMYIGNSGFSPVIDEGGVITRTSYVNGSNWITMLHYPRECITPEVQRYTDPTREYTIASNEVDGKGGVLYYPNYGEFLAAYAQGTTGYLWNAWDRTYEYGMLAATLTIGNTGWTLKNQQDANGKFLANPDLTKFPGNTKYTCTSFYDVTAGGTLTQPTGLVQYDRVTWNEKTLKDNGTDTKDVKLYPTANTANTEFSFNVNTNGTENNTADDTKITSRDFRGWHQFVLNAYAANTEIPMQPSRSYQTDNDWWTLCLPYSLTYNEVMLYYGDVKDDGTINDPTKVPVVCLLSNVIRDKDNNHITLNFSSNLMEHKATHTGGEWVISNDAPNKVVGKDTEHGGTADIIVHAGVPYMIKPYFAKGAKRVFDVYAPNQTPDASLSDGRIRVSATAYPGLYEKLKYAEGVSGANFRRVQEDSLYTVPALILKDNAANSGETYDNSVEITYNNKTYYRSTAYDYTFVGALQRNIIPPYSYFLGYKGKSLYVYADYLDPAFEANKKPTTPDYKNTMKWTNNACVICPNMLSVDAKSTQKGENNKYNLQLGNHNGLVTPASGTGSSTSPAQWKIYGNNLTAILTDDRFSDSGAKGILAGSGYDINFGYDMEFSVPTAINGVTDYSQSKNNDGKVYTIDGRYTGESLEGLTKGVYIMNGKKYIIK